MAVRKATAESPLEFTNHKSEKHTMYFNAQLPPQESRRQMIQRLIKKQILSKVSDLTREDIAVERGRGEVWVGRRKAALVEKDGETWSILCDIPEAGLTIAALQEEVEAALAER